MDSSSISARPDVTVSATAPRVTPTPPKTAFKEVLAGSLVSSAQAAMKALPGSPLMAVAIRGAQGPAPALGVPVGGGMSTRSLNLSAEGPGGSSQALGIGAASANAATSAATGAATGAVGGTGVSSGDQGNIESSLQQSQEMNLYYLQVQEAVNAQTRSFETMSNVMKAEHDTVKNAIGNIH